MKILILTDHYPPNIIGGAEINCELITQELIHRGHSVIVLTSNYGIGKNEINGNIFRVLKCCRGLSLNKVLRRVLQIKRLFAAIKNYSITKKIVKMIRPNLVFIWNFADVTILPVLAVQDLKVPTLFHVGSHSIIRQKEDIYGQNSWIKIFYHSALIGFRRFSEMQVKHVIFIGENLANDFRKAGVENSSFRVIKNGIPDEWILNKPLINWTKGDSVRLLYVGRISPEKGSDIAIKTLEVLIEEFGLFDISLDLFGTGNVEYMNRLKDYVTNHNLSEHINFHGYLDRDRIINEYARFNILIFPTPKYEGLSTVIIEAMARGLFVIASRIGGPMDIITHGKDGILVYPIEPGQFALTIYQYLSNPAEITRIKENAIKKISENFRFSKMIDEYEEYILELIK